MNVLQVLLLSYIPTDCTIKAYVTVLVDVCEFHDSQVLLMPPHRESFGICNQVRMTSEHSEARA